MSDTTLNEKLRLMKQKRILVLGSYPIKNPQHGGQKRTAAIVQAYRENFSSVRYAAIFYREHYEDFSAADIAVGKQTAVQIDANPNLSEIYSGEAVYTDPKVRAKVAKLITTFKPDVIHVEQPYIYLGLQPLLADLSMRPKLIYGSQNIEFNMKKDIFSGLEMDQTEAHNAITKVRLLEEEFSKRSDLVAAVSAEDAMEHKRLGAKRVVLAANGVAEQTLPAVDLSPNYEGAYLVRKRLLFIGSAHQPNWQGFEKMVTRGLGFLPPDSRIYIAGGVSDHFAKVVSGRTIEDITFWQRVVHCGRVSERRLSQLLAKADVILLPITEGGGSNLKTAEAFMANKKIVATSYAMRSYEYLKDLPNLFIADQTNAFHQAIITALATPYVQRTAADEAIVRRVLWKNCLADLVKEVAAL